MKGYCQKSYKNIIITCQKQARLIGNSECEIFKGSL